MRFLREGRSQSLLTILGAAVGVTVLVFLSALITGLEKRLIKQTLGTQAHIVVRPPDEVARPMRSDADGVVFAARVERTAQRARSIVGWQQLVSDTRSYFCIYWRICVCIFPNSFFWNIIYRMSTYI